MFSGYQWADVKLRSLIGYARTKPKEYIKTLNLK